MKRYLIFILAAFAVLCSCKKYNQIEFGNFRIAEVEINKLNSIDLTATVNVNNPTKSTFIIDDINGILNKENKTFATIVLTDADIIASESEKDIHITCRVNIKDPLSILALGLDPNTWDQDAFRISGTLTFKTDKGLKKSIKIKNEPLSSLLKKISVLK